MKKVFFVIITLFIILPIVKADTWFGSSEKISEMNVTFVKNNNVYSNSPFLFKMIDGKIVYCVKPFTDIGHDNPYTEYLYNDPKFSISNEHLEKIKLIAYYGYNYPGHEEKIWYGITQFLIWKTFDLDDIYFTNGRYGDRVDAYQNEIREIENLINAHDTLPSFYDTTFNLKRNSSYVLEDTNYVLDNYNISDSNIDSYISDNNLYINTKEDGEYFVELKRKRDLNNNYILYGLDNYQTLFYPGGIEDINIKINIEVNTGSITIHKISSDNSSFSEATLEGAEYSIIQDNLIVEDIITNVDGVAYINNLGLGQYVVKEKNPSSGYLLDENTYYANITSNNKDVIIKSYEQVIKSDITLEKYYKDADGYKAEYDSVFELYNSKNEKIKEYELKDGQISDTLLYGNYYLKQIKGIDNYKFVDDYYFNISSDDKLSIVLYNYKIQEDPLIVSVPNTGIKNKIYYFPFIIVFGILLIILSKKTTF